MSFVNQLTDHILYQNLKKIFVSIYLFTIIQRTLFPGDNNKLRLVTVATMTYLLPNICVTNDYGFVPFVLS